MDEIMRGMQGTFDKASIARLRPLPVWVGMGVVTAPVASLEPKTQVPIHDH